MTPPFVICLRGKLDQVTIAPRLAQGCKEIVSLIGWEPDQDFPIGPQGAKPKRIMVCPNPPPHGFLIGGHRYLFKEPAGTHEQQIWSEVIAYELSRDLRLPVPPAFLAQGPGNGGPGVLVEFFYGYHTDPTVRFVHAVERLQGIQFPTDFRRGSLKDNIVLSRLHQVKDWRTWWARTLAFDATIGNSDRHTENWGLLIHAGPSGPEYALAPAFDNGTSLGYIVRDQDLNSFTRPERIQRLVERGKHHYGWVAGDVPGSHHARLCRTFRDYIHQPWAMDDAIGLTNHRIQQIVDWCCSFEFPVPFTEARGRFVAAQLRARRDALTVSLGA